MSLSQVIPILMVVILTALTFPTYGLSNLVATAVTICIIMYWKNIKKQKTPNFMYYLMYFLLVVNISIISFPFVLAMIWGASGR